MSDERGHPRSYEERVAACPIHSVMDVDGFLERENVPDQFRRPFHEIILARGQFPLNATEDQIEVFAQEANQITSSHRMDPMEAHLTNVVFKEFMGKWRKYSVRSN